ncbi:MAG: hypothetical protein JWO33_77 [Caulobacteraceae bacterium]|nr:hypothetical protein [Caulobacteraceae bacterium]
MRQRFNLLDLGVGARLGLAAAAAMVVWLAVLWALA